MDTSTDGIFLTSLTGAPVNDCVDVADWFSINYNDQTAESYVRGPIAMVYVLIFLFSFSGNLLVVVSVVRHRSLQTVRNFFIVSLSCSDIVVCLTSLPITPVTFILKNWYFGSFLCYAFPLVQGMSVCISTFTLTAVAVDRYILIIFPTRKPIQRPQAVSMIISIWALAAGVCVPMVVHYNHFYGPDRQMDVQPSGDTQAPHGHEGSNGTETPNVQDSPAPSPTFCGYFCEEIWPSENVRQIYGSFVLILQFLVPLTIISFCYAHICIRLAARDGSMGRDQGSIGKKRMASEEKYTDNPRLSVSQTTIPDLSMGLNVCTNTSAAVAVNTSVSDTRRRAVLRRKRRTNRMLIAMVVIFGVCWAPQVLMNILRDLGSLPTFVNDQMYFYSLICHAIAMSSTIWNPILYSWMNESFRRAFMELLPCFLTLHRKVSLKRKRQGKANSSLRDMNTHYVDGVGATEAYLTLLVTNKHAQPFNEHIKSLTLIPEKTETDQENNSANVLSPINEMNPLLANDTSGKGQSGRDQKDDLTCL